MDLLIWMIGSLFGATWRVTISDPHQLNLFDDRAAKRIYCLWHADLLALAYIFRNTDKTVLVSKSSDGLIAAAVARRWKYDIICGSSSRGGSAALREALRVLNKDRCVVVTTDGPRGPRGVVKPGAAQMALSTGAAAVMLNLSVDRAWHLNSWDRFVIPKPFAHLQVTIKEPLFPLAKTLDETAVEAFRTSIEERLSAV